MKILTKLILLSIFLFILLVNAVTTTTASTTTSTTTSTTRPTTTTTISACTGTNNACTNLPQVNCLSPCCYWGRSPANCRPNSCSAISNAKCVSCTGCSIITTTTTSTTSTIPYYQAGSNHCGFYSGSSPSCGSSNNFCKAGQSVWGSCSQKAVSCISVYCEVCGDCTGGSDTCGAKACGTTGYKCSPGSVCTGLGTGAGNCVVSSSTKGATCYCDAMCSGGLKCSSGNKCVAPPSVSVSGAPDKWQNKTVNADVSCTDETLGCDKASYRFLFYPSNPGPCPTEYTQYRKDLLPPQTISTHFWVCAAAKNNAGIAGFSSSPTEFKIDTRPPQTIIRCKENNKDVYCGGYHTSTVKVSFYCGDEESGCSSTKYCVDVDQYNPCSPNNIYTPNSEFDVNPGITYQYVKFFSTDNAGNTGSLWRELLTFQTPPALTTTTTRKTTTTTVSSGGGGSRGRPVWLGLTGDSEFYLIVVVIASIVLVAIFGTFQYFAKKK